MKTVARDSPGSVRRLSEPDQTQPAVPPTWPNAPNPVGHGAPDASRNQSQEAPEATRQEVAVVTPEELVSPVSRQAHRDMTPGKLGYEERWDLRRIAERLVVEGWKVRHDGQRFCRPHVEFSVVSSEV